MCGRGDQSLTWAEIHEAVGLIGRAPPPDNMEPHYNLAPTSTVKIVRLVDGRRVVEGARWDLVPHWWKKPLKEKKFSTFNARAETLRETASYRTAWRKGQRCVVPMNFYEWRRPKQKGEGPYYIHPKKPGLALLLAGLWDEWTDPETGEIVLSFSIITVPPNELIAPLHDRMPAILAREQLEDWFNAPAEAAYDMLKPCPPDWITLRKVSNYVNDARHQGPDCVKPETE